MPRELEEEPDLDDRLLPYVEAFAVLSAGRTAGMSVNPIALTEIEAYSRMYEVDDTGRFVRLIRAMDRAYMDHAAEKAKTKAKADGGRHRHNRPATRRSPRPAKR